MARPDRRDRRANRRDDAFGAGGPDDAEADRADEDEFLGAGELTAPQVLEPAVALALLRDGDISVEGQVVDASNATLYVRVEAGDLSAAAAYKPVSGERPLWDFPDGTLAEREVAAFTVAQAEGGDLIPPTVLREGPFGTGMVQLWVESDPAVDVRQALRDGPAALRRVAVLDAVINNGDRKGGHLLPTRSGRFYGIDHGVSFSVEEKLRTVLWNWAGDPLTAAELERLENLRDAMSSGLAGELEQFLTVAEVRRTRHRIDRLLRLGCLPMPSRDWPPVPWPAM